MELRDLRFFCLTAELGSVTRAAEELGVSQPFVTKVIHQLEEELGILIFERTNKGITLTDEGREFITYARKAVAQYGILEDRYLAGDHKKERFSVSTQHYNFAIRAFTDMIRQQYTKHRML